MGGCSRRVSGRVYFGEATHSTMGEYYVYANVAKREFLDPADMGYDCKRTGLLQFGPATALGLLMCRGIDCHPLCGSWSGDEVIITGDYEHSHPTTDGSAAILYEQAQDSFANLSYRAVAMLCLFDAKFAPELAECGKSDRKWLQELVRVIHEEGCRPLESAFAAVMGEGWAMSDRKKKVHRKRR